MTEAEILKYYSLEPVTSSSWTVSRIERKRQFSRSTQTNLIGILLIVFSVGALWAAVKPFVHLDLNLSSLRSRAAKLNLKAPQPTPGLGYNPLITPDGKEIRPVNTDFSLVVPSIGINASVIPGVNPTSKQGYSEALLKGIAHASTSFYPDQNGTVYLFSHSTNYEWFVKDLNAVFYLLKNVKQGDLAVVMYLGNRYTYRIRESRVVKSKEVSYLTPQPGVRTLILQTCWPPGTAYQRLLIFADLIDEAKYQKFGEISE